MTDRHSAPERSPSRIKHTLQWLNAAGSTVPAFGVIRLAAFNNTTGQYTAQKHDGAAALTYVNGPAPVANGAYGGSMDWSASRLALVASGVTLGQEVGPVAGSYIMSGAGTGFVVFSNRDATTGTAAVVKIGGGGGGGSAIHGIVSVSHGKGWYTIELSEWAGAGPDCEGDECDPCAATSSSGSAGGSGSGSLGTGCAEYDVPPYQPKTIGTGVFVLAYHRASALVPLELNTDCLMMDLGDTTTTLSSGLSASGSPGGEEPVYQIIDGYQTHTVQYREQTECCGGVITVTRRQAIYFAALVCEEEVCNNCDSAPG